MWREFCVAAPDDPGRVVATSTRLPATSTQSIKHDQSIKNNQSNSINHKQSNSINQRIRTGDGEREFLQEVHLQDVTFVRAAV